MKLNSRNKYGKYTVLTEIMDNAKLKLISRLKNNIYIANIAKSIKDSKKRESSLIYLSDDKCIASILETLPEEVQFSCLSTIKDEKIKFGIIANWEDDSKKIKSLSQFVDDKLKIKIIDTLENETDVIKGLEYVVDVDAKLNRMLNFRTITSKLRALPQLPNDEYKMKLIDTFSDKNKVLSLQYISLQSNIVTVITTMQNPKIKMYFFEGYNISDEEKIRIADSFAREEDRVNAAIKIGNKEFLLKKCLELIERKDTELAQSNGKYSDGVENYKEELMNLFRPDKEGEQDNNEYKHYALTIIATIKNSKLKANMLKQLESELGSEVDIEDKKKIINSYDLEEDRVNAAVELGDEDFLLEKALELIAKRDAEYGTTKKSKEVQDESYKVKLMPYFKSDENRKQIAMTINNNLYRETSLRFLKDLNYRLAIIERMDDDNYLARNLMKSIPSDSIRMQLLPKIKSDSKKVQGIRLFRNVTDMEKIPTILSIQDPEIREEEIQLLDEQAREKIKEIEDSIKDGKKIGPEIVDDTLEESISDKAEKMQDSQDMSNLGDNNSEQIIPEEKNRQVTEDTQEKDDISERELLDIIESMGVSGDKVGMDTYKKSMDISTAEDRSNQMNEILTSIGKMLDNLQSDIKEYTLQEEKGIGLSQEDDEDIAEVDR